MDGQEDQSRNDSSTLFQRLRRECGKEEVSEDEKAALIALLRAMMAYRPEERPTAMEIMESEWMRKWALLDMENM